MAQSAAAIFGAKSIDADSAPLSARDDFVQHGPGAYFFPGNGTDGAQGRAPHNPAYDFNDCILADGPEFWAFLVETQLAA
jgi:hippurate hydrolase